MGGVIKYNLPDFQKGSALSDSIISEINPIRDLMYENKFIGIHSNGVGYGAVAQNLGKEGFLVTGTGTGGLEKLTGGHYSIVSGYDSEKNLVIPKSGAVLPSSEFMTLATVFDCNHKVKFVLHGHIPRIWENAEKWGIRITSPDAEYGTPEMAQEVERLFAETDVNELGIFVMGGHKDGMITFGETAEKAWKIMLDFASQKSEV